MSEYVFKLPDLGEGLVEAEIAEWMVGPGDAVEEEDAIAAVLTDKAAVEVSSPVTGKVVSLAGDVGDTVAVGSALIVFETDAEPASVEEATTAASKDAAEPDTGETPPVLPVDARPAQVLTSPSVRRQAREAGVDLAQVSGSGPRGRILRSDLESFIASGSATAPVMQKATGVNEIKVIGLRRKIAERMEQANREVPHFAYVEEIDITALESLRRHLNGKKAAGTDRLTLLPFIGLALARVLRDFPQCNALYDQQRNVIRQFEAVHLGIATQTDDGLKVPVVRHAEALTLEDLAAEIRRVSEAARDNTARRDELLGSTITITSLGKLGGIASTPVINIPEVAIVGVNKAVDRPVVMEGQVVVRRMMNLSSSFDHRFVDGYDGAMMIQALKGKLEQPATIFMPD
ncbi:MAG: dihydrolipoamide acetyltransferase family protein [Lysobacterales bacterium]|jgi:2-oxoisovalerate dehydrogenase E2 component (dihydrolipoyl transacylase)